MKTKYIVLLTGVIAVLSVAATAWFMRPADTQTPLSTVAMNNQPPQADGHSKDSERLLQSVLQEMEKLRAQVGKLEQQQASAELLKKQATPAEEEEANETPQSLEEAAKRREALVKSHKDILENSLRQEQKDTQWAEAAQAKLSSTYSAAADKGVRFVEADCRSTVCKVEMSLDQPGKKGEIQLSKLMDEPAPWSGPRFMQMDKQTGQVVMYMMRENHKLPDLPTEANN